MEPYTERELWQNMRLMHRNEREFQSLIFGNKYRLVEVNEKSRSYSVEYASTSIAPIPFADVYAIYQELYAIREMPRNHLRQGSNAQRIVGHPNYKHRPGATIFAILPKLDPRIVVEQRGRGVVLKVGTY